MEIGDLLGEIEIIKTPAGEAPETVRESWVGVVIPCCFFAANNTESFGLLSSEKVKPCDVYVVLQQLAIEALSVRDVEAASWWVNNGFPRFPYAMFSFHADEVRVINPVLSKQEFEVALNARLGQN